MSGPWACPLCHQTWQHDRWLRVHLTKTHYPCRFCPRSQLMVDRHERLMHTLSYADAEREAMK